MSKYHLTAAADVNGRKVWMNLDATEYDFDGEVYIISNGYRFPAWTQAREESRREALDRFWWY